MLDWYDLSIGGERGIGLSPMTLFTFVQDILWRSITRKPLGRDTILSCQNIYYDGSSAVHFHSASLAKYRFKYGFTHKINNVEDVPCLHSQMVKLRPQPSVVEFTKLLTDMVKLKQYPTVISPYKDMCALGIPVNEFTWIRSLIAVVWRMGWMLGSLYLEASSIAVMCQILLTFYFAQGTL